MSRSPEAFAAATPSRHSSLPPGQYLTLDFPVLSAGPTPHVPLDEWRFEIGERSWSWDEFATCRARRSPSTSTA